MVRERKTRWLGASLLLIVSLYLQACNASENPDTEKTVVTEQLNYDGSVMCAFSGEPIETVRYGGRLTMEDGTVLDFMSSECLAGYVLQLPNQESVARLQVTDFTQGKRLLDVEEVVFLHSRLRPSPNGMNLSAIKASDTKMRTYIHDAYPGPMITWEEVLELVETEWNLKPVAQRGGGER